MKKIKTILVTGGAGFIGSHTTVELIQAGYEVVIVDNFSNSSIDTLNRIEKITSIKPRLYNLDLRDKAKLKKVFRDNNIESVIHFAALKAVGESVEKPVLYYQNNIVSLLNLLEVINEEGKVKNFVFSSSACVYGNPKTLPVNEDSEIQPATSPYGATKKMAEDILHDVSRVSSLQVMALRYFNPIGAHVSGELGELPQGEPNNLLPYLTQVAVGKLPELKVFGNDYDTADGYAVRDFIHVVDLAQAHIKALERMETGQSQANFEVYNLGTGHGYSVKEIIDTFEKVNNVKVNYRVVDRRAGDIAVLYTEADKAHRDLNWRAELGLSDMLKSAWKWENTLIENN